MHRSLRAGTSWIGSRCGSWCARCAPTGSLSPATAAAARCLQNLSPREDLLSTATHWWMMKCLLEGRRDGHEPWLCRCQVSFGAYGCLRCAFFEDETASRKQFHCEQCGLCRIGGRASFFHCDTCGCCYTVSLKVCSSSDHRTLYSARLWKSLPPGLHANALNLLRLCCRTTTGVWRTACEAIARSASSSYSVR